MMKMQAALDLVQTGNYKLYMSGRSGILRPTAGKPGLRTVLLHWKVAEALAMRLTFEGNDNEHTKVYGL